jgi:hypothetical protein
LRVVTPRAAAPGNRQAKAAKLTAAAVTSRVREKPSPLAALALPESHPARVAIRKPRAVGR